MTTFHLHPVVQKTYFPTAFLSECESFKDVASQFLLLFTQPSHSFWAASSILCFWRMKILKGRTNLFLSQFSVSSLFFGLLEISFFIGPSMHLIATYDIFTLHFQLYFRRRILMVSTCYSEQNGNYFINQKRKSTVIFLGKTPLVHKTFRVLWFVHF